MFYRKIIYAIALCQMVLICMGWLTPVIAEEEVGSERAYIVLPDLSPKERFVLAIESWKNRKEYLSESNRKIRNFSEKLETYIRRWLNGQAEADFPKGFLPLYIDNEKTHSWKLVKPEEISPEEQWYAMETYDLEEVLHQFSPDPHTTYLKLIFLAPLNSKLIIEGDFPHARFMDYQILTPVDPAHPVTGQMGICEVPIVDVDIDPLPGHTNPFRIGVDRTAQNRSYRVVFDLKAGNAAKLNGAAMKASAYRAKGNTRVGGPFAFTGPWGGNVLVPSVVWLRYYAPDKDKGPYGGVPLPKATLQLPSGETYWITCDKSLAVKLQTEPVQPEVIPPKEPYPFIGPSLGWFKMYGIMESHANARGYYKSEPWGHRDPEKMKQSIKRQFKLMFNRGMDTTPPGNVAHAATECNYISYLLRPMNLGKDKVIVLTGKLPTFPSTRNGEKIMEKGQVRYLSITHQYGDAKKGQYKVPYGSLMDDEIIVNNNNEYIIVYSCKEDRPKNAYPEFGVTWQEWGSPSTQTFVLRWLSVMPDWYLPKYAPDEKNIPQEVGVWASNNYDETIVGKNRPGMMGPYHPIIHYMTKEEFEEIGFDIDPKKIPEWEIGSITNHSSGFFRGFAASKTAEFYVRFN